MNNQAVYRGYITRLNNAIEDYDNARTEDTQLEALRTLDELAMDLADAAIIEGNALDAKLTKEAVEEEAEIQEASRGQY